MINYIRSFITSTIITQFIKYGLVGLVGTAIQTSTLIILVELYSFRPIFASIIGFIGSLIVSFILNLKWTFQVSENKAQLFIKYVIVSISGLILNVSIMFIFVDIFGGWYIWAQIIVIIIVPIVNFIMNRFWAFSNKTAPNGN